MDEHVIKTYRRAEPVFVRGQGACLYTDQGREYLDFLGGIAVSALGHGHPKLVEALQDQVGKVLHVSNLLRHPYTEEVAERVTRLAGMAEVFFCNSGTEANEAALKIARKHHFAKGTGRTGFVALEGSFHGRTMGALSVTHNRAYREPFAPLCGEVTFVAPGERHAARPIDGGNPDPDAAARRRVPADRHAAIVAIGNVEATVDKDGEAKSGAAAELQHPHAALDAVAQRHEPDPGELGQGTGVSCQVATRPVIPIKFDHIGIPV